MRWMLLVLAACASTHEEKPAGAPELARAEPAAPEPTTPKAAGDPCSGGQLAQPQAQPTEVAVADKSVAPPGGAAGGPPDHMPAVGGGGGRPGNIGGPSELELGGGQGGSVGAPAPHNEPRARMAPGTTQIEGKIDEAEVKKTIRRGLGQLKSCADRVIKNNPSLSGLLAIQFVIGADGHVTDAQAVRHLDDSLDKCVIARLRRFEFPKPQKDPVSVLQPFNISPE